MTAPVLPADTNPCAWPSRTSRDATRMELSRLERTALAALSSMVTHSAGMHHLDGQVAMVFVEGQLLLGPTPAGPPGCTLTPKLLAARTAPSTSAFGAWSPPIASTAMVSMWRGFYSCSTSTTSRPLYWPQCGHTRWGSLGSWQFGHSERPAGFSASCARRLLVRRWECLRLGFGISLPQHYQDRSAGTRFRPPRRPITSSEFQLAERSPAIVRAFHPAIARGLVPVPAANRADALARFAADALHGQGQHDLFQEDILQLQAAAFVKPYLRLAFVDLDLFLARRCRTSAGKTDRNSRPAETGHLPGTGRTAAVISTEYRPWTRTSPSVWASNSAEPVARNGEPCSRSSPEKSISPGSKVSSKRTFRNSISLILKNM